MDSTSTIALMTALGAFVAVVGPVVVAVVKAWRDDDDSVHLAPQVDDV
jgi:hypothetical protein